MASLRRSSNEAELAYDRCRQLRWGRCWPSMLQWGNDERNKAVSSFECGITQHGRKYLINRWKERPMHRQADIHTGRQTDRQRQERYEQANLKHNVAK